jgi:hypothetical protein
MKRAILLTLIFAVALFAQTDSITLSWPPNAAGGTVTTYDVFRSLTATVVTTSGLYATVAASACTQTTCSYVDTAVIEGTTYWYEIEACNATGCSGPTPAVSATVPFQIPNVPATPTIVAK